MLKFVQKPKFKLEVQIQMPMVPGSATGNLTPSSGKVTRAQFSLSQNGKPTSSSWNV